jgi:hypothetical protein
MLVEYPLLPQEAKEIVDYTIKETLRGNPELRIKGKVIKPKQMNFWSLTWSDIILLRLAITDQNMLDVLSIVFQIGEKEFMKLELFNAYAAYIWVVNQFKAIIDAEIEQLASELSDEEKDAGAEDLQEFGYTVALDGLTKGDLLKYDDYLMLPYSKVFRKMCLDKTKYDINKQLQENASRKSQALNQ